MAHRSSDIWQQHQDMIATSAGSFPEVFGLRAYPNKKFRIELSASYVSEGRVYLYVYVLNGINDPRWESFCKGTVAELAAQIVRLGGVRDVVNEFAERDGTIR